MPVYLPIKPKDRLYQEIVDQIQQQILSGALKPGDQIPAERDLADRFGVSRTAVREAIKSLTEKGLIEVFVGRGTFVTSLSPDRVVESITLLLRNEPHNVASLQEAREMLEVPTARLAAERRSDAHIARLRAITAEMEEEQSISPRLVDGDTEFHVEVARATGNPVLVLLSQTIVALLRSERLYREDRDAFLPEALASHRRIIEAIADRDGERASSAMTEHLAHVAVPTPATAMLREHAVARVAS
jgi:GntR family transcriptional regulator, transcriptional repressor for pyruvate dehydrogenase complex